MKEQMISDFLSELFQFVFVVVMPFLTKLLYDYVQEKISDSRYNEAVKSVYEAVKCVQQTFVDDLKKQDKWDIEAQKKAFSIAKDTALSIMKDKTASYIEDKYNGLSNWLDIQIEKTVAEEKDWK